MNIGKTIFSQLMEFVPRYEFDKCVKRYDGHYKVQSFSCWEQFLCMSFAQLTYRESLRDIETCMRSTHEKLYHLGIKSKVSRSTLAKANENRNWRIYRDFACCLIKRANQLYANDKFADSLKNIVYALDSTAIELCTSLFPWAAYCKTQAAVKMHALLNLRGNIPSVIIITDAFVSDSKIFKQINIEPGAIYIVDRAYICYTQFLKIHKNNAFFVSRAKSDTNFKRLYSLKSNKAIGIKCDQIGLIGHKRAKRSFSEKIRRIKYYDQTTDKNLTFLTNELSLPAEAIANLYKNRWQIELFFKWIKQHLRIKAFYGRTENAVNTQIWIAISTYVLIAIVKKELKLEISLYTILQILSISIFEKTLIFQAVKSENYKNQRFNAELPLFTVLETSGQ